MHIHGALAHLQRTRAALEALSTHAQAGRLPEAVEASKEVESLLCDVKEGEAKVWGDVRKRWRSLRDRVEEQLGEAYARSVVVTPTSLTIRPFVTGALSSLSSVISSNGTLSSPWLRRYAVPSLPPASSLPSRTKLTSCNSTARSYNKPCYTSSCAAMLPHH